MSASASAYGDYYNVDARFPPKLKFLFKPAQYKVAYGGRGSAKSWNFARALVVKSMDQEAKPFRILCAREFQNSIQESVHALLVSQITALNLHQYFRITDKNIVSWCNNEFIFKGLHNNVNSIRSMEAIKLCWVEEAANVSQNSWDILLPTLFRVDGGELWVSFNPVLESDPTYKMFVKNPLPGTIGNKLTWRDNPWFPAGLRAQMEYLRAVDYEAYLHIWEGECRSNSDAQVLRGKCVVMGFNVSPDWHGPYQGVDWGFANDPTTLVRCYISADGRKLFIDREAYGLKVDIDKTAELFDQVNNARKYRTYADNARPETISYMQRHGYPEITGVEKWPGSVEDGITFLRQFEKIIIHSRCEHAADEARLYSYKIDKLTNEVLPEVVDKHNHIWDAVRYALFKIIQQANSGLLTFMEQTLEKPPKPVEKTEIVKTTQEGMSIPAWVRDLPK